MSEQHKIQNKMFGAVKWSFLGEGLAKLITPFTNMALARILEPDDFGLLSIVTMIISFADLFTDAGFQKYLVQHYFKSEEELYEYASVAFWTNLVITAIIWIIICVTAVPMTVLLNKPGYQWVIRIGTTKLFLTTFTSVQRAIYQRSLDYKTIFKVRIIVAFIPVVITLPLALIGFDYWALIIGVLASESIYALILTYQSKWRPKWYYSFEKLKKMFSFSIWSLIEQFTIWLSSYVDTFILSVFLTDYVLGLYKQPKSILSSLFGVFTASLFGVLFSALSRYNDSQDEEGFWNLVFKTQLISAIIVLPLGVGIYLFRDLATLIALGSQWSSASIVMGLEAISLAVQIVMNNVASEIYRAKGEPWLSVIAQTIYVLFLVPLYIYGVQQEFSIFVSLSAGMTFVFTVIHYTIIRLKYGLSILKVIDNIKYPILATTFMALITYFLKSYSLNIVTDFCCIICGGVIYVVLISWFKPTRKAIKVIMSKLPSGGIFKILRKMYKV